MGNIDPWEVIKALWAIVISVLVYVGKREVRRIDKLEESRATKDEVDEKFDSLQTAIVESRKEAIAARSELREDIKEQRDEARGAFERIFDRLDKMADGRRPRGPHHN